MTDLRYPVGKYNRPQSLTPEQRKGFIKTVAETPSKMRAAVAGLTDAQLDTPYRPDGWSVRQVVHHVADSHLNAYTRIKLALTEDNPTIKTYEEHLWAELPDSKSADPAISLAILDGVHRRLTMVLNGLTPEQFRRPAVHPANGPTSVDGLMQMYAWHCRHHLGHIGLIGK